MDPTLPLPSMADSDQHITDTVVRETARLRNFIRSRVTDQGEAEDILQDVFYELVEACRLPEQIEQVGAWLFRVARNRIIDRFRKKKEVPLFDLAADDEDDSWLEQMLPATEDAGPEAAYARSLLIAELQDALEELPAAQREVFIAHELERRSFKELAQEAGLSVNTLLARKRYAVLALRERLQDLYDEFNL
ncbi:MULTISPECIES: RNA polymerase sigma factor [unclassified Herbaspirillum]|uniref:RNA polymerase sigma factor n=1 Tax=unclassified Herbaspirillum TaxID=2624150 RepID=UPI001615C7B9|nr:MULTISPECIES: sigma-70 family RNA polymerase sigma factor [unclassified Herbaspirillum]